MSYDLEDIKIELKQGRAKLLDVREQAEWDAGHLAEATLLPLSRIEAGVGPGSVTPSSKIYLHCRSGNRVRSAAPLLKAMGFMNVIALSEGFETLLEEGFEEA